MQAPLRIAAQLLEASAEDIESVIEHVHGIVLARTRVSLVREVRIVGEAR